MNEVDKILEIADKQINEWFENQYKKYSRVVYSSVDIRDSGEKIVPVDTNLFPAGFNNIDEEDFVFCVEEFSKFIDSVNGAIKNIFILCENHTRNRNYFLNLYGLKKIIKKSGYDVWFVSEALKSKMNLADDFGIDLVVEPFLFKDGNICTQEQIAADIVISNNDFSDGIKSLQEDLSQARIFPDINMGWFKRKKSNNILLYSEVIEEFCNQFGLNKFFFSASYENCGEINFKEKKGIDCVANKVDKLIHRLSSDYQKYKIKQNPYVFIKAERGTYGMGVMSVNKGSDVYEMNKKLRNKMDIIKGGVKNSEVIIQEGIETDILYKKMPAEIMVYLINGEPVSVIQRYHESKDKFGSLNSPGLQFRPIKRSDYKPRHKIYSLIAKLSSLAASREIGYS